MIKELKSLRKAFKGFIIAFKHRNDFVASKDVIEERMDICNSCEHIDSKKFLLVVDKNRCGLCGCFLKYKTKLTFESCPADKW